MGTERTRFVGAKLSFAPANQLEKNQRRVRLNPTIDSFDSILWNESHG